MKKKKVETKTNWLDDSYGGRAGFSNLPKVASQFPFPQRLKPANFPKDFVNFYVAFANDDPIDYESECIYFLANFKNGIETCSYDALFSPQMIQMQNGIISESNYADEGSIIMPPDHYAVGSAYNSEVNYVDELRLMINLAEDTPDYGKIYAWHLAYDPLGEGDNKRGLGYVAPDVQSFILNLKLRDQL